MSEPSTNDGALAADAFSVIDAGAVLTPVDRFSPGRIIFRNGLIESAGIPSDIRIPPGSRRIDATGMILAPGFVDPHVHGCGGADVMEGTYDTLNTVSRVLARHGTTSFLPTTVSSPPGVLDSVIDGIGALLGHEFQGARPLGIHLEGPFINRTKRGTHPDDYVLPPDARLFSQWLRRSPNSVKLLTLAPELEGAGAIVSLAIENGISVGMGHSDASAAEATSAADRGVCYAVHTFNAMRQLGRRDPGITGVVLADDRIFAEIIADGVHVAPEVVRIFARAKGRDRILLATDATSATGMPDGPYLLGRETVTLTGGVCRDREGRLAGSALTQDVAFRNFVRWTGMSFEDALFGLTLNPARALRLESVGAIEPGRRADIVMLDRDLNIVKTFVGGNLVFERRA